MKIRVIIAIYHTYSLPSLHYMCVDPKVFLFLPCAVHEGICSSLLGTGAVLAILLSMSFPGLPGPRPFCGKQNSINGSRKSSLIKPCTLDYKQDGAETHRVGMLLVPTQVPVTELMKPPPAAVGVGC